MLSVLARAWRSWMSAKAVALLVILALGVGIGATTAIYTVVHAVLWKPLPYLHGERFVALYSATLSEPNRRSASTFPAMVTYQQQTQSFDAFGWFRLSNFNLTSPGLPQHLTGVEVTPALVNQLGVNPERGRWFRNPADESGGVNLVVISHALWQRLGSDPNLVGQPLTLDRRRFTITGVMPPWFRLPVGGPGNEHVVSDIWIPLDTQKAAQDRASGMYFCYARLKPGVTQAQAQADVQRVAAGIAAEIAKQDPSGHVSYTARLDNLREAVIEEVRPALLLLFGAAALLLLITCANVAGLLVARSVSRARETAVCVALGAPQRALALQYFTEGLVVALAGAAVGVCFSLLLVRLVVSLAAEYIPRADEIAVDWTVFLFALGTALLASTFSSLAPLWQAKRTQPNEVLNDGVRASAGVRSRKLSQLLVIAEIAVTFTLLAVSSVLVAQLHNLSRVWPGFDPRDLLTFQLTADDALSGSPARLAPYQKRLVQALKAVPGVRSAALVNQLPLIGCCLSTTIFPEGRLMDPRAVQRVSYLNTVPEYLRTMQIPLLKGRFLTERDTGENPALVVVNQAAATYYWPSQEPVGAYGHFSSASGSRFQVVGVVGNVRNDGLDRPTVPEIYISHTLFAVNRMHFVVRSSLPERTLVPEIRRAVQSINPTQPIHDVRMMSDIAEGSLSIRRVSSFMTSFFGLSALLMTTLGVYGVISYAVRQRTVEIGTRMALGAVGQDLVALVVGDGAKIGAYGVAIGALAAAVSVWLLVRFLDVQGVGVLPFVATTALVAVVVLLASFFPAWRATLLSPMVAIRNQPESMWESARQSLRQTWQGIAQTLSRDDDAYLPSEGTLLTAFVEASRRAGSYAEALHLALETLCNQLGAGFGLLLENSGTDTYRCAAAVPSRETASCALSARGFLLNRLTSYAHPLPLTTGDFEAWLRWASEYKPQYLAEIQALRETGARIAVPLRARDENLGILLLGAPADRERYSPAAKQLLEHCAEQFSLMIENARLTDRVVEQEKIRRDLTLAAEVQKRLLPEVPPHATTASLAAVSVPARIVGGDYYDFFEVGDHRIGVALADIAGKGIAAALIMSVVQASLRVLAAERDISLPQLAAKMNRFLHRSTAANSYATFFYAQLDEQSRQLRYVNAGHNPPYLFRCVNGHLPERATTEVEELPASGTVLGLFPLMNYEEATLDLTSGDVLLAFTDGVTEALNPQGEEFGEERLKELVCQVVHLPVQEITARISAAIKDWIQDAPQHDDLTFVALKMN